MKKLFSGMKLGDVKILAIRRTDYAELLSGIALMAAAIYVHRVVAIPLTPESNSIASYAVPSAK